MAIYHYKAITLSGNCVKGQKEVINADELYDHLKQEQLYLLSYEKKHTILKRRKPMNLKELSTFCRELGTMIDSGMDILTALEVLIEGASRKDIKEVLQIISNDLYNGKLLSEALFQQNKFFPMLLIDMFKAGEASGRLSKVCITMHQQFEKENKIQQKIKTAMIYPFILSIVSIIVVLTIFVVIMPSFATTFNEMPLPWITSIMMKVSNFIIYHSITFVGAHIIIGLGMVFLFKNEKVHNYIDYILLKLPKIGHFMSIVYTSRFARSLSSLYISGVNIVTALDLTASTINNSYIEGQIKQAATQLKEGYSLSFVIGNVKGMDIKLIRSISVGEESGKLDSILNSLSDEYDDDAIQSIEQMLALMEPVLIVLLGLIVAIIVIAVLMPIYTMYNSF